MLLALTGAIYDYDGHLSLGTVMVEGAQDGSLMFAECRNGDMLRTVLMYRATGASYGQRPSSDGWSW